MKPPLEFRCPHCKRQIREDLITSFAGKVSAAKRKDFSRPSTGRPRTVAHKTLADGAPDPKCTCVDCRRAKGYTAPRKTAVPAPVVLGYSEDSVESDR
jgi:hypothetical protein